jgi:putative transposase
MYVSVPPKHSPSYVMKVLKGRSAERLRKEFPELKEKYWGMHLWARGYFVSTVGIDRDIIKQYVKDQIESQVREDQLQIWRDNSE